MIVRLVKYRFEFSIIFVILSIISGVVIWFILDYFMVKNSIEIAVISTIMLVMFLVSYYLHGKGLLPDPNKMPRTKISPFSYTRNKIRSTSFKRNKFLPFSYKKRTFKNSKKTIYRAR
jgi:hypothetical protein